MPSIDGAESIRSVPGVCEVRLFGAIPAGPGEPPDLLVDLPHGATRSDHYHALRRRLTGEFPQDLQDFFFVNTDVGTPECAQELARCLCEPPREPSAAFDADLLRRAELAGSRRVLVLRSLIPRTFIDCNRVAEVSAVEYRGAGVTPALPEYVTSGTDAETLRALHRAYHAVAEQAFSLVCGNGGTAVTLHSYAPRSVRIKRIDGDIVKALRRAYDPEAYPTWDRRPDVDIISEAEDGTRPAPADLVSDLRRRLGAAGFEVEENATYRLHPATMAYRYSTTYPGQVLCLELNRSLLVDPFTPFEEMTIGDHKVAALSHPIAAACLSHLLPSRSRSAR